MHKKAYRFINIETLKEIKVNGKSYKVSWDKYEIIWEPRQYK
jgi:hypothetical protein